MKGFVWNKIADAKVDGTVWEKTDDSKFRIDTNEFESLFGEREREEKPMGGGDGAPGGGGPGGPGKAVKAQKVVLLDPKRSNNCCSFSDTLILLLDEPFRALKFNWP
jgi:hypothetical protein